MVTTMADLLLSFMEFTSYGGQLRKTKQNADVINVIKTNELYTYTWLT
jgi:hypothetical protein